MRDNGHPEIRVLDQAEVPPGTGLPPSILLPSGLPGGDSPMMAVVLEGPFGDKCCAFTVLDRVRGSIIAIYSGDREALLALLPPH